MNTIGNEKDRRLNEQDSRMKCRYVGFKLPFNCSIQDNVDG